MAKKKAAKKKTATKKTRKLGLKPIRNEITDRIKVLNSAIAVSSAAPGSREMARNKSGLKRLKNALREIKAMCPDRIMTSDFTVK